MLRAYLQLLRIPNVFTAWADVLLGFLATHQTLAPWSVSLPLLAASGMLYLAGMALNDVYDVDIDRQERPERPIPSGRVPLATARALGFGLLLGGMAAGWLATAMSGNGRCGIIATLLAVAVWYYDAYSKRTPLGPLGMGLCRFLNVLLGMSAAASLAPLHYALAAGVGLYVVGITLLSRNEAEQSQSGAILRATLVMAGGVALAASYPQWPEGDNPASFPTYALNLGSRWYLLWGLLGLFAVRRAVMASFDPSPGKVQLAVKQAIISLIVIDAAACYGFRGLEWSLLILVLLLPMLLLGRWIYST